MTILDSGYGALHYEPTGTSRRLWAMAWQQFALMFKSRLGILLYLLLAAPATLVKLGVLYANLVPNEEVTQFARAAGRSMSSWSPYAMRFYTNLSTEGFGFLVFLVLTCLISIRSIAGDRATNALEIYWTRGISPWGYFLAKWLGSALLLSSVLVGGPLLLWILGNLLAPDLSYLEATAGFMPQVLVAITLKCLLLTFLAVGFSAMAASTNTATFLWLILILGTEAVGLMLARWARWQNRHSPELVADGNWYKVISPWEAVTSIEISIAGDTPGPSDLDPNQVWIAWLFFAGAALFVLLRLRRCLRSVEAVA